MPTSTSRLQTDEGNESWGRSVFDEIVEPERIAYTDAFSDAEGNVNEAMPETKSTIEFTENLDGRTVLTLRAAYPTPAELQQVQIAEEREVRQ